MNRIGQLIILTTVLGASTVARADDASAAFAKGKAAMKANKVTEACAAYAESETLRAAVETELALAECLEKDGKLVAAAKYYRMAADKDTNAKRVKTSGERAMKLEKRAPKLRFAISPSPEGVKIQVDGVEVAATGDVLVDLGPHEVTATAPGYAGRAKAAVDREGQILDVILSMEPTESPKPAPMKEAEKSTEKPVEKPVEKPMPAMQSEPEEATLDVQPSHSNRRRNGLIVGGVGLAALASGVVFFVAGADLQSDSDSICPNSTCGSSADLARATDYRSDGRLYRGIGIGAGIGGAVLLVAGGILWATAPKESAPVALRVDSQGAAVSYTFGF